MAEWNSFPEHCYFVRNVPIEALDHKINEDCDFLQTDWCLALMADIEAHGLACPLLIDNEDGAMKVFVGHNRAQALRHLGWTHVPAVIHRGEIPSEWERTELNTLREIQDLLREGRIELRFGKIYIFDTQLPESMTYPTNPEPYTRDDNGRS